MTDEIGLVFRRCRRVGAERPTQKTSLDSGIVQLRWRRIWSTVAPTFSRDLNVSVDAITLPMSSAPSYRGDPLRANPEQLFVAALSACQALTYLVLAARNQIAVVGYTDDAEGRLEPVNGKIRMSQVTLRPHITLDVGANETRAREFVDKAHHNCPIANSVSATVEIAPTLTFAEVTVGAQ